MYPESIARYERGDGYSDTLREFIINEGIKHRTLARCILLWVGVSVIVHSG